MNREQTQEMRSAEAAKLDALEATFRPLALAGDEKALAALLKVMDRRSKLFGLDLPAQHDRATVSGPLDDLVTFG